MSKPILFTIAVIICQYLSAQPSGSLHQKSLLIDTHNDFVSKSLQYGFAFDSDLRGKTHSDLRRMGKGGMDIQIFSIWGDENTGFAHANLEIDTLYSITLRNPDKMMIVRSPGELEQAVKEKKLGVMLGVEGGHMIENDLEKLDKLHERGARYMTLTWNNSTSWASSAVDEAAGKIPQEKKGLNEFGVSVVRRMNELGMMVDLSHVGEQTFVDALSVTTKPVIVSHSSVHAIAPVPRNLKDYQLSAIKQNGGVVCVNFFSGFLDSSFNTRYRLFMQKHQAEIDSMKKAGVPMFFIEDKVVEKHTEEFSALRPPLSLLIDHIDYIAKKIGADHVGLGSDFDGIHSSPRELNGVEDLPKITKALKRRGYSKTDIRKILGENVLRVFRENQKNIHSSYKQQP
jgi:membrane dipeptidase